MWGHEFKASQPWHGQIRLGTINIPKKNPKKQPPTPSPPQKKKKPQPKQQTNKQNKKKNPKQQQQNNHQKQQLWGSPFTLQSPWSPVHCFAILGIICTANVIAYSRYKYHIDI